MRTRWSWWILAGALPVGCAGAEIEEGVSTFTSGVGSASATASGSATAAEDGDDGDSGDDGSGAGSVDDGDGGSITQGTADGADEADGGTDEGPCVPSGAEVCDGDDNDCNGSTDESDPQVGTACETGLNGACSAGALACSGGELVCEANNGGGAETCNGVDDDCDGSVDQGNPGGGGACETGLPGICSAGTSTCQSGGIACVQNNQAAGESCNGADDDCDGAVDNGNPGGGAACNTGLAGICAAGTQVCQNASLVCSQNQGAVGEACGDGLDNDCDGTIDNGCCAHDICVTGVALVNGCHPCVSSICGVDPFCCATSWDSLCVGEVSSVCGLAC